MPEEIKHYTCPKCKKPAKVLRLEITTKSGTCDKCYYRELLEQKVVEGAERVSKEFGGALKRLADE